MPLNYIITNSYFEGGVCEEERPIVLFWMYNIKPIHSIIRIRMHFFFLSREVSFLACSSFLNTRKNIYKHKNFNF